MGRILTVTIELGNAAFDDDSGEVGRILRMAAQVAETQAELDFCGLPVGLRDINGNTVGSVSIVDTEAAPSAGRRFRGHTLLLGGSMVTLWPVEIAGAGTYPPKDCKEPLVWFHHTENDMSEPCDIVTAAMVNRWGWAYCSDETLLAFIEAGGEPIQLKRKDREALMHCGNDNSEILRRSGN